MSVYGYLVSVKLIAWIFIGMWRKGRFQVASWDLYLCLADGSLCMRSLTFI